MIANRIEFLDSKGSNQQNNQPQQRGQARQEIIHLIMVQTSITQICLSDWTDVDGENQNYITQDDGTTTVVIEGVDIDNNIVITG